MNNVKKDVKKSNDTKKKKKNSRWQNIDVQIEYEYLKYLDSTGKIPTYTYLADKIGISQKTLWMHMKNRTLEDLKPHFKPRTKRIIDKLARVAEETGRAQETKLYLQVIEDFQEKTQSDVKFDMHKLKKELENIFEE